VVIAPAVTGYTSLDGTVNARLTIISAPIEGTVTATPPKVGLALPAGTELLGIRNDRVERTVEVQNEAELAAARERLDAIDKQRSQLAALHEELAARRDAYQLAIIRNLDHEIDIRRQRITTAQAQQQAAESDFARKQKLGTTGIVADVMVEQARAASIAAQNAGAIARAELERLNQQLDAARRGVFLGEGRNDVPYSQQRLDEVTIQLADLEYRERELKAKIEQLDMQHDEEHARNRTASFAIVRMPFEGVI